MKESEIKFKIKLDKDNIPETIVWEADESPSGKPEEAKAIALNIWDHSQSNTLRIDLWGKELPVFEMKKFYIDIIGGMSETIKNATGDEVMSDLMNELTEKLVLHLERESKQGQ